MKRLFSVLLFFCMSSPAHAEGVVASIKPLHSLVAGVMEGDTTPLELLVDGKSSPHGFTLRPSQVRALQTADVMFYMGDSFEIFLERVFTSLPDLKRVPMQKIPGIRLYGLRLGRGFEPHRDEGEKHHDGGYDLHLWMSPANAKLMVTRIADTLSETYPQKKELYQSNAKKMLAKLDVLDKELQAELQPVSHQPYIVFHDAYQYFEKAYGMNAQGSITLYPDHLPGADHLDKLREKVIASKAVCVFREPQYAVKLVDNLLEGIKVKNGMLDPEGVLLPPGPELYFDLMRGLAKGFRECLL